MRLLAAAAIALAAAAAPAWDVRAPAVSSGQSQFYFSNATSGALGVPITTGDFNGDGFLDIAAAPLYGSTKGLQFEHNGYVAIFFGDGTLGRTVNMAQPPGNVLVIAGAAAYSLLGVELGAGDLDGDGIDDLVAGSSHGKFIDQAPRAGEVAVLYGSTAWGDTVTALDIGVLPQEQRARFILGERDGDRLGSWFQVADLDGNTVPEIIAGMDQSDGPTGETANCGAIAIVWNVHTSLPGREQFRVGDQLFPDTSTVLYGRDAGDMFGATHVLGDFDGDGKLDLAAAAGVTRSGLAIAALQYSGSGAGDGPGNNRQDCGEVTIIWDIASLRNIRRDSMNNIVASRPTTTIYGERTREYFGEELQRGDLDGDGIDDLFAGAILGRTLAQSGGAGYIIRGGKALRETAEIDLASSSAISVPISAFDGAEIGGIAADTIELGDINADGIDDIFFSVPVGTPSASRTAAGYVYVYFGGQDFPLLPQRIGIFPPSEPQEDGFLRVPVLGGDSDDLFCYSSAMADLTLDGVPDFIPNAMKADGFDNGFPDAGECYAIDGRALARSAAVPTAVQTFPNAGPNEPVARWSPGQPVFGAIEGYEVTFAPNDGSGDVRFFFPGTQVFREQFAGRGRLTAVRMLMARDTSLDVVFQDPVVINAGEATPTPTPTPTPTRTPTPTPTPVPTPFAIDKDETFDGGANGWQFRTLGGFEQPSGFATNSALEISVPVSSNAFGFWEGPPIAAGGWPVERPLRIRYDIASSPLSGGWRPQYRIRASDDAFSRSDVFLRDSWRTPNVEQPLANSTVAMLAPGSQQLLLFFDGMNFFPGANGFLALGRLDVEAVPAIPTGKVVLDSPFVSGGSRASWEFITAPPLAPAVGSAGSSGLVISGHGTGPEDIVFGAWTSWPIMLEPGRLYRIDWDIGSNSPVPGPVPTVRLRANSTELTASYAEIGSMPGRGAIPTVGAPVRHTTYFATPANVQNPSDFRVFLSFDFLRTPADGNDPAVSVALRGVTIYEAE